MKLEQAIILLISIPLFWIVILMAQVSVKESRMALDRYHKQQELIERHCVGGEDAK